MLTRRFVTFLIILLLWGTISQAMVVKDLYSAQIPVVDQSSAVRSQAIGQAFMTVLVKVTGNTQLGQQSVFQTAAKQADNYTQQFSYIKNDDSSDGKHPYLLEVDFLSDAINTVLLQNKAQVWGRDRPLTLFWIANNGQLVGANSANPIATLIDKNTDNRGIPGILPLLDLTDVQAVSSSDVQAPFVLALNKASARYGSNAMVILRIKSGASISSRWTLLANKKTFNWQLQGTSMAQLINDGVNKVADTLASQFAVSSNMQQTQLSLQIYGLHSLADFAKARDYLQSLAPVKQATIGQIAPDHVTFALQLLGSEQDLQEVIDLDHTLKPIATDTAGQTNDAGDNAPELEYQWGR
jgi:hypothetical protein